MGFSSIKNGKRSRGSPDVELRVPKNMYTLVIFFAEDILVHIFCITALSLKKYTQYEHKTPNKTLTNFNKTFPGREGLRTLRFVERHMTR